MLIKCKSNYKLNKFRFYEFSLYKNFLDFIQNSFAEVFK